MTISTPGYQARGFTAVEVLVTLFIATLLMAGAHQIYGIVTNSTKDARERATASNYAYESLRRATTLAPANCAPEAQHDISSQLPEDTRLSAPVAMTAETSCPYGDGATISQITIRLTYGTPQKEVAHALYIRP